ncbi:MAG TPA: hypothetical protein VHD63_08945 [Ktedonobacteraceae bacterium]|jgi:hypothetical protein|nr:hypothetical protein [Ktedonobacteraceae bacterium]
MKIAGLACAIIFTSVFSLHAAELSAHEVMSEEPGKVLVSLVKYALPIALRAGDGVP